MMQKPKYGAVFERGIVKEYIYLDSQYRVESLDRPGVVSRPMYAYENGYYSVGDEVFYFMFDDGTGLIMGEAYVHPADRRINKHPEAVQPTAE